MQTPLHHRPILTRRDWLRHFGCGFAGVAATALFGGAGTGSLRAALNRESALTPRVAPLHARAKSVIFLYMDGGVSQVDSFDYKPLLEKHHGEDPYKAIGKLEKTQFANVGKVFKSPWKFSQRGQSGLWVSDLFPHIAEEADRLCVIKSMTSKFPEHTSANYFLHSGTGLQGRPSMGAWVNYGLGTLNQNVPGFVVLNGGLIPSGGADNFNSGFLPATYQASLLEAKDPPLANIRPSEKRPELQRLKTSLIQDLDRETLEQAGEIDSLESAIANHELAARMQLAVPDLLDIQSESEATRRLYGLESDFPHTRTYARQCLIARRLVERGVRFVELTCPKVGGYDRWDAHSGLQANHGNNARAVDQPIRALLLDLDSRGLLDETLVVWSGEFGRTPFAQGSDGRDHNEYAFTVWMAGAGVKGGFSYGETDDWGYKSVVNPLEMHDFHATLLYLLGIEHTQLTYRFGGRDIRLTDVSGHVVKEVLA